MNDKDMCELLGELAAGICLAFIVAIYATFVIGLFVDFGFNTINALKVWAAIVAVKLAFDL